MRKGRLLLHALVLGGATGLFALMACSRNVEEHAVPDTADAGGETTAFRAGRDAFAMPLANLPTEKLRDFSFGNKLFNTNWVTAPASVTTLDGLGPTFNRVSCSSCHFKDGRGRPPLSAEDANHGLLMRLSVPGKAADGGPLPHAAYGLQLNEKAIRGVPAEGRVRIEYREIKGRYPDGAPYALRAPDYRLTDLAFGPPGEDILTSPRVAPPVFGLGLLEAVPEETILAWADPDDRDGDGISGRPNWVWDAERRRKTLGRFGWKANVANLKQQDAGAANGDIGITTALLPEQNCPAPQTACRAQPIGGNPELTDAQLAKLLFYSRTLAPPARRHLENPAVRRGAALFGEAQCSACHKPSVTTGAHEVEALSGQRIQPFTDLLLHDMGEGLADGRPDFKATGSEWRTPPLWGIGLTRVVNRHTFFLHDGRARNVEEAILWHGGEAEAAKRRFMAMKQEDRAALIAFLESL